MGEQIPMSRLLEMMVMDHVQHAMPPHLQPRTSTSGPTKKKKKKGSSRKGKRSSKSLNARSLPRVLFPGVKRVLPTGGN